MTGWDGVASVADYGEDVLRGRLVRLRELREADLPQLEQWWRDPTTQLLQAESVRPQPDGPVAERFRTWSANSAADGGVGFSVESLEDERLIGHATLWGATARTRCATLAVIIGRPHWGAGLGTDTVRTLVRYGFAEMGLHRIELAVWAFNDRALRAYRAAGFVEEGRRREVAFHDGRWHDQVCLGLLAHEAP